MIRVSATQVEAYRRLLQTEYGNEDELIASVMGHFAQTSAMKAGAAWHSILEKPAKYLDFENGEHYLCDGHSFAKDDVERALFAVDPAGLGVWEVKATKVYTLPGGDAVTLVAKADWVRGSVIQDSKLTLSSRVDLANYERSFQWRAYLDVHGAKMFVYNRFRFAVNADSEFRLADVVSVAYHAYPGMYDDVLRWLNDFYLWAENRGLLPYLAREGTGVTP